MLALCWPLLDLSGPYVASMFAHVSRMLAHVGPKFALCCPMLTLCWLDFGARGRENIANSAVLFLVGAANNVNYNVLGAL